MARASHLVLFFIFHLLLVSVSAEEGNRINPSCPFFSCGTLGRLGFPFSNQTHPECGLVIVEDCNKELQKIQLGKDAPKFYVRSISQDNTLLLEDLLSEKRQDNHSCRSLKKLTIPSSPFITYSSNQTLLKCPRTLHHFNFTTMSNFSCDDSIFHYSFPNFNIPSPQSDCSLIQPLVKITQDSVHFSNLFTGMFSIGVLVRRECYDCHNGGGQCQSDRKGNFTCSRGGNANLRLKQRLGLGIGVGGLIILTGLFILTMVLSIYIIHLCKKKKTVTSSTKLSWFRKKKTETYQNVETFLRNNGSLAPKRYSYSDIKKMTNSFKHKLGQGGYGGVYKGRLLDGRNVAVKVLNEAKGNGQDFINEVASISRTSHINIVTLLGFCFNGRRRALIYEFVSNGSLEKFIYEKHLSNTDHDQLKWETLYQIALGIARGLEYLHRGCNTRILHFDIKPHNILLDEEFCPKISDFGLAKICPGKESNISMTGARGTPGYIAPEVFCRNFGEVSHKSDVYSYGMMVLEMAGGRKNMDAGVDHTSEIYFPHWIYKHLELDEELGLRGVTEEDDNECARKMIVVGLWCIQTNPSNRPTMSRVVEMLEGSLGSMQIPPKPFLSSPRSSPVDSSISHTMLTL